MVGKGQAKDAIKLVEQALERMRGLMGTTLEWTSLAEFLPEGWRLHPRKRRSAMAASFAATLEMVKRGETELRQDEPFAPILLRKPEETARV